MGRWGNLTDPFAIRTLAKVGQLRGPDPVRHFHPKVFIFRADGKSVAWVGSANFTSGGFGMNGEAVFEICDTGSVQDWFDRLWEHTDSLDAAGICCFLECQTKTFVKKQAGTRCAAGRAAVRRTLRRFGGWRRTWRGRRRPWKKTLTRGRPERDGRDGGFMARRITAAGRGEQAGRQKAQTRQAWGTGPAGQHAVISPMHRPSKNANRGLPEFRADTVIEPNLSNRLLSMFGTLAGVALGALLPHWLSRRRDLREIKRGVLRRFMANRRPAMTNEQLSVFNEIPVVFAGDADVEKVYRDYRTAHGGTGGFHEAFYSLAKAMAESAGVPHQSWDRGIILEPFSLVSESTGE